MIYFIFNGNLINLSK